MTKPNIFYSGKMFKVIFTADAQETFSELGKKMQPQSAFRQFVALITRYADHGKLNAPDQINAEGNGSFAIKHDSGLRAYCWYCEIDRGTIIVSHFLLKKTQKLSKADKSRMQKNKADYKGISQ